jgi:Bacterial regulatory proteins, luxR family
VLPPVPATAPATSTRPGELSVSPNTVSAHIRSIYAKLQVRGRASAVRRARELRLLAAGRTRWPGVSAPGEHGLLEMCHPGGQAVQRQLAELVDDGGRRSVASGPAGQ